MKKVREFIAVGGAHNGEILTEKTGLDLGYVRYNNGAGRTRNNYGWKKTTERPSAILLFEDLLFELAEMKL